MANTSSNLPIGAGRKTSKKLSTSRVAKPTTNLQFYLRQVKPHAVRGQVQPSSVKCVKCNKVLHAPGGGTCFTALVKHLRKEHNLQFSNLPEKHKKQYSVGEGLY